MLIVTSSSLEKEKSKSEIKELFFFLIWKKTEEDTEVRRNTENKDRHVLNQNYGWSFLEYIR